MLKNLLIDHIRNNVPDRRVAVLLSGGVDSISVGLAAQFADKEVHAYSFQLGEQTSYDFAKAAEVAYKMQWDFTPVIVPRDNLIDDWHRLVKLGCRKKTHFECVFPFLYLYPLITETHVVTGWGADGYFGVSKKAMMRYSSLQRGRNYVAYCKEQLDLKNNPRLHCKYYNRGLNTNTSAFKGFSSVGGKSRKCRWL